LRQIFLHKDQLLWYEW